MPDVGAPPGAPMFVVIGILIGLGAGAALAFIALYALTGSRLAAARRTRQLLWTEARRAAEAMGREAQIEAREQSVKLRAEVEQEVARRRSEIIKIEERVLSKEEEIDRKLTELSRREQGVSHRETHSRQLQEELKQAKDAELDELERISGMTTNEAKAYLLTRSEELIRHELARRVRQLEEEAQTEAKRRARNLVADALQRVAANHASETTVSLVELPSDDMKGRIIGREGRNIRTLEHLTGVDFIIDDTPQAVVLSSFDGIRREIAKVTLAKLIEDGRIHPARIEEMYYQSKAEIEEHIVHAGEQAVFEANCGSVHEELVKILGRLRFRTSHGQNGLKHSHGAVPHAGIMASELDASGNTARRAGRVEKVSALQAGREIRVIVKPKEVDDDQAVLLSHEIAGEIEDQLEYPGQIKVTVIRESRAVEVAKNTTEAGSTDGNGERGRVPKQALGQRAK